MSEETNVVEEKPVEGEVAEQHDEAPVEGADDKVVEGSEEKQPVEDDEKPVDEKKKVPLKVGGWQKRVNELTKRLRTVESQLSAAQAAPMVKPERNRFATDEQYNEALIDFKVAEKMPQVQKQLENGSIEQQFSKNEEALRAEIEDYDDIISERIEFPHQSTIDAIVSSEMGPRIRYYLGTHPEETEALLGMNATSAARQIGKIEAKLESELQAKKGASAGKPVSQAKPPIKPVRTSGSTAKIDPNKLSDQEWFKLEQQKKRERFKQT
jgi:hypothetical protein